MIEAEHARTVRVPAPLATVWNELSPLDRLMRQVPEVAWFKLEPDGRSAQISTNLAWGPIDWKLAQVSVAESEPPHRFQWRGQVRSLRLDFEGTFELSPAPAGDGT